MLFFFFSFQMLLGGGEASWEERRACSQPTTYRSYDQRLTLTAWNVTLTLGHYIDLYIRTTGAHVDRNKTLMADDSVTCIETLKITASKESFCFFLEGEGARTNGTTIFFFMWNDESQAEVKNLAQLAWLRVTDNIGCWEVRHTGNRKCVYSLNKVLRISISWQALQWSILKELFPVHKPHYSSQGSLCVENLDIGGAADCGKHGGNVEIYIRIGRNVLRLLRRLVQVWDAFNNDNDEVFERPFSVEPKVCTTNNQTKKRKVPVSENSHAAHTNVSLTPLCLHLR